jgi:hypothetical protein
MATQRHARDESVMAELRAHGGRTATGQVLANPDLTVEYLGQSFPAVAGTVPNSPDRDRLFQLMSEEITGLYDYQDKCRDTRQIPIIRLRRS